MPSVWRFTGVFGPEHSVHLPTVISVRNVQISLAWYTPAAQLWFHNATVKESKVSVASFMPTWKRTRPSGKIALKMDSVWVPLQLLPPPWRLLARVDVCLGVWIRVSGCFCNAEGSGVVRGLPWKCCLITQQTQTVLVTLTTQNYSLDWTEGEEEQNVKFQWVSLCVSSLVKTQRREFDRVITRQGFYHLCSCMYYQEGDWDSVGTSHHLCVTGRPIAPASVCLSLLKLCFHWAVWYGAGQYGLVLYG